MLNEALDVSFVAEGLVNMCSDKTNAKQGNFEKAFSAFKFPNWTTQDISKVHWDRYGTLLTMPGKASARGPETSIQKLA